jgi:hypothetical protein
VPVRTVRMVVRFGLRRLRMPIALKIRWRTVVLPHSSLFSTSKVDGLELVGGGERPSVDGNQTFAPRR